jgi:hypothetical protein
MMGCKIMNLSAKREGLGPYGISSAVATVLL